MRPASTKERFQRSLNLVGAAPGLASVLLLAVIGLGLLFRLWDIVRPFIGYHMWNEVYYATIARNFEHFGLLAQYNYDPMGGMPFGPRLGPSPLGPWLVYLSYQVFGPAEWAARVPMLLLGLFSLVAVYGVARELYSAEVGLGAAFFAAIMPGVVFFSRQVALESPMAAFGLAAVWTLLVAKRTSQLRWMYLSAVLLAMAIMAKYTAVLFVPSVAWIGLTIVRRTGPTRKAARWALPITYLAVAALPAAAWLVFGMLTASSQTGASPVSRYLTRAYEWSQGAWFDALLKTWTRLGDQIGGALWYPLVIAAALAITTGGIAALLKRHVVVALLIIPWFAQMVYPASWYANDGYTYPALYGVAVVLALLVRAAVQRARHLPNFSGRRQAVAVSLLGVVVCLSSLMDYRAVFHSWYSPENNVLLQHPVNSVTHSDPFQSARLVRSVNVSHLPILADLPVTLYYSRDEDWRGESEWLWWGRGQGPEMVAAIGSRKFSYVVFTYQPPVEVTYALAGSGYRRIGPAAWEKIGTP
jgi:4-amino-4-deoxy-L-arabinose transferase-like glycosyltransferase